VELIQTSWTKFDADLIARIASGMTPDLVYEVEGKAWSFYAMQGKDSILPIDDLMEEYKAEFTPKMLKCSFIDGHYREIPYGVGPVVLFYRKDLFDAAGLKPPRTWDELYKAARALTQDTDGDGKIDIYGYTPTSGDWMAQYELHSYLMSNGASVTDKDGKVVLYSPQALEALKFYVSLFDKDIAPPGAKNYKYGDAQTAFITGKPAMVFTFGYILRRIAEQNPEIVPYVRAVPVPRRSLDVPRGSSGGRNSLFIPAATKHPKEVKNFLRFLLAKENCLEIIQAYPGGNLPAMKSIRESQEFKDNPILKKFPQATETLIDECRYAARPGAEFVQSPYGGELEGKLSLRDCIQKVTLGGWSPEKALKWTDQRIREMFESK